MNKSLPLLILILLCSAPMLHAAGGKPDSEYTSIAKADALSEKRNPQNPDRAVLHFHGLGGYDVLLVQDGEVRSSWVNLLWHGHEVDLYDTTKESAPEDFYKKNDKIEWRGLRGADGKLVPYAIIYRVGGTKNGKEVPSRLIVIKLSGDKSEVLGYGQGANEDAEAKEIADKARPIVPYE